MIRNLANFSHWIGGVFVALLGATLVRVPLPVSCESWIHAAGHLLAWAGLAWITLGVSRRVRRLP